MLINKWLNRGRTHVASATRGLSVQVVSAEPTTKEVAPWSFFMIAYAKISNASQFCSELNLEL